MIPMEQFDPFLEHGGLFLSKLGYTSPQPFSSGASGDIQRNRAYPISQQFFQQFRTGKTRI